MFKPRRTASVLRRDSRVRAGRARRGPAGPTRFSSMVSPRTPPTAHRKVSKMCADVKLRAIENLYAAGIDMLLWS